MYRSMHLSMYLSIYLSLHLSIYCCCSCSCCGWCCLLLLFVVAVAVAVVVEVRVVTLVKLLKLVKLVKLISVYFFDICTSKKAQNPQFFTLLTSKCASRHNGVHFFDTFSTSEPPKVVRDRQFLTLLTWKCASRHNGVHFFDIATSKSGPNLVCFVHFDLEMCFAPQRRALFRHRNFQKWSGAEVFCTFWLGNVLRATTACTFSTSQLPKVVRTWGVLYILTWKCASRHNGVQFFIAPVASWLRTRRFSEPTFRPSGATNHWKNTVFRDFPTFSRICIFCPLTLSLLIFSLLIFLFSLPLPCSAFHPKDGDFCPSFSCVFLVWTWIPPFWHETGKTCIKKYHCYGHFLLLATTGCLLLCHPPKHQGGFVALRWPLGQQRLGGGAIGSEGLGRQGVWAGDLSGSQGKGMVDVGSWQLPLISSVLKQFMAIYGILGVGLTWQMFTISCNITWWYHLYGMTTLFCCSELSSFLWLFVAEQFHSALDIVAIPRTSIPFND